jgi:hypothetical protein
MRVSVYLIVKPTGLVTEDGLESVVVVDVKLTRLAAEQVAKAYQGAEIVKLQADKTGP